MGVKEVTYWLVGVAYKWLVKMSFHQLWGSLLWGNLNAEAVSIPTYFCPCQRFYLTLGARVIDSAVRTEERSLLRLCWMQILMHVRCRSDAKLELTHYGQEVYKHPYKWLQWIRFLCSVASIHQIPSRKRNLQQAAYLSNWVVGSLFGLEMTVY